MSAFKFSKAYPSPYLREPDLQGREVTVTIAAWRYSGPDDKGEDGKAMKGVIIRVSPEKELVLNITNYKTIQSLHGFEPETWVGKSITLYPTTCRFGKESNKPCIRVKI